MTTTAPPQTGPISGTVDISVLGQKRSFPFELTGTRQVVGTISVTLQSHLEPVNPSDARWLGPQFQNQNVRRGLPNRPMPMAE